MTHLDILRYRQRLDHLFEIIAAVVDDELKAHWARYLCVLANGFLEISVRRIYGEYTRTKSGPHVTKFVEGNLKRFTNPKMDRILGLTRSFNPEWEDRLRTATEGELKESVDSIVANKNSIAHGENVGITYGRIRRYYDNAVKVVGMLERQCSS